jgi:hypothetical protein
MKKLLFVVAVVALLIPASYARDILKDANGNPLNPDWEYDGKDSERKAEAWNWPASYNAVEVCVIPVRMDVGFWIKVNGCKDLKLDLKQVSIHSYQGQVDVSINCNVNIKLSADWSKATGMPGMDKDYLTVSPSTLDAPGGTVTIKLGLKNVDLQGLTGGQNCVQVGTVTLKVTPNVTPQLAGGCG